MERKTELEALILASVGAFRGIGQELGYEASKIYKEYIKGNEKEILAVGVIGVASFLASYRLSTGHFPQANT